METCEVRIFRWGPSGPSFAVRVKPKARPKRRRARKPLALPGWTLSIRRVPKARPVLSRRQRPVKLTIVRPDRPDPGEVQAGLSALADLLVRTWLGRRG